MKRFGEKLRILRRRDELSQRELSRMLDVHHSYIGQLELGQKIPNAMMILKIADIFSITADQLMRDELELDGYTGTLND
jgi:transcriptional regulator with XRE-family HTH domain